MKKILGYVITEVDLPKDHGFSEFIKTVGELPDTVLPRLIVGWAQVQRLFPGHSILEHQLRYNLWWTFSPQEDHPSFERIYYTFLDALLDNYFSLFQYRPANLINTPRSEWLSPLEKEKGHITLYHHMPTYQAYCYLPYSNLVVGYDLKMVRYQQRDEQAFVAHLKESYAARFFVDDAQERHYHTLEAELGTHPFLKRFAATLL